VVIPSDWELVLKWSGSGIDLKASLLPLEEENDPILSSRFATILAIEPPFFEKYKTEAIVISACVFVCLYALISPCLRPGEVKHQEIVENPEGSESSESSESFEHLEIPQLPDSTPPAMFDPIPTPPD